MRCPHCGVTNPDEFRFCGNCGTALPGISPTPRSPAVPEQQNSLESIPPSNDDEFLTHVIAAIQQSTHTSRQFIGETFGIGGSRLADIMDRLECLGVVGPDPGGGAPRVITSYEDPASIIATARERDHLIRTIRKSIHEMADAIAHLAQAPVPSPNNLATQRQALASLCFRVALRFANANHAVTDASAQFLAELIDGLSENPGNLDFFRARRTVQRDFSAANYSNDYRELTGAVLSLLRAVDVQRGTRYVEDLRAILVDLASIVMRIDGIPSTEGQAELEDFETFMQQEIKTAAATHAATHSNDHTPVESGPLEKSLEECLTELHSLTGLESVKHDVAELVNFLKVQELRRAKGLPVSPLSLHMVFYGNPGTGKTTVARLLAQIYRALGILSKGHLVETDRSGLVAGYVGQTALKVNEVVNRALGGILFIDEAYALWVEGANDFGLEAIETLMKQMEDHRHDLIVIVAGYPERMSRFLSANPGMRSRFNRYLRFEDYSSQQLVNIFESFCKQAGYRLSEGAGEKLTLLFQAAWVNRDETFGNARFARNLFEQSLNNQANRIVTLPSASVDLMSLLDCPDIPDRIMDGLH